MRQTEPVLVADGLSVALDSDAGLVRALDGVRLAISRGETFALVGESGCGKSMTALALMRLLPENGRVTRGTVHLQGEELLALSEADMRKRRGGGMGMIFQDPSTCLNPVLRVGEQILEAICAHTHLRGAAARVKALEWMRLVGIPEPEHRFDSFPFEFSGGQKQRIMIAIALAAEPQLLIADEPTTALDVTIQAQILELLQKLQRRLGMGILLITHDLGIVSNMAHHVALMYAGQLVEVATARNFFAHSLHPYAMQLFSAIPGAHRRNQVLATVAGSVPSLTAEFPGCRFVERCVRAEASCSITVPELVDMGGGHAVRCLLYRVGAPTPEPIRIAYDLPTRSVTKPALTTADDQPILEVRDLRVDFHIRKGLLRRTAGSVRAVDGVSLSVMAGKTLALVGESGCGKTTTGKAILQLLKGQASIGGDVLLLGRSLHQLTGAGLRAARRDMQMIFQDPYASLDPRMQVRDILEEGLVMLRKDMDEVARRLHLADLLEQVGLRPEMMTRYAHEFSGGQRQRLAIARALSVQPRLIICDEPTSALDVSVQAQILNLFKALQSRLGIAFLFITHNIAIVEYLADSVAVMHRGKIIEAGPVQSVLDHPEHDYTRSLIEAVPRFDVGH